MRSLTRRRLAGSLSLCLLLAFAGATLPVAAQARSHGHASKTKKRKRKPKTTTVLVKCAAVTVTCKGTPGPQGPQGPAGTNGTNGANVTNVLNGAALVADPHTAAPLQTVTGASIPAPQNLALTGTSSWTQMPGEVDYLTAQMNVTAPPTCVASGADGIAGTLYLDGHPIGFGPTTAEVNFLDGFTASSTYDVRAIFNALGRGNAASSTFLTNLLVLPAPATATPHTLGAGVVDACSGGTTHYTVNSFSIQVAAAK